MIPPRPAPAIVKLSDRFGQYEIALTCAGCGHVRVCNPQTLAALAGWDARLDDLVQRLRCSKCHQKRCSARCIDLTKPRGLRDARS